MLEMYLECHIHIKCEDSALCSRFVSIGHKTLLTPAFKICSVLVSSSSSRARLQRQHG